jgi:hypothetical protein
MFSSYTGRRHKKKFVRNKCSKFLLMSFIKFFQLQKEACGYAKEKVLKKRVSVQDVENNGYSDARHEKKREKRKRREKERKKMAHVL